MADLAQVSVAGVPAAPAVALRFGEGVREAPAMGIACLQGRCICSRCLSPHLLPVSIRVLILAFMLAAIAYVATSLGMWLPLRYSRSSKQPYLGF